MSKRIPVKQIPNVTQDELKKLIHYDKYTGIFTWLCDRYRNKIKGKIAGAVITHPHTGKTYRHIEINGKPYRAHRLAWLYMTGELPEHDIDHIDGQGDNNSWNNLRKANKYINARNCRLRKDNKYGVCGIYFDRRRNKWLSYITFYKKRIHLGYYTDFYEAVNVRRLAEIKYGFHPNHGIVRPL